MTQKKNERNAGRKPKYKPNVETTYIRELVPKKVLNEVKEAINVIVTPYLTEQTNKAIKKAQDENLSNNVKSQLKK